MSSAPTPPARGYSFTGFQTNNPATPLPADEVDGEIDRTNTAVAELIDHVAVALDPSTGQIKTGAVGTDQIDPGVIQGIIDQVVPDLSGDIAAAQAAAASAVTQAGVATTQAGVATAQALAAAGSAASAAARANDADASANLALARANTAQAQATDAANAKNDAEQAATLATKEQELAGAWAEHLDGANPIPPAFFAHTSITGDHWSARYWANQAAQSAASFAVTKGQLDAAVQDALDAASDALDAANDAQALFTQFQATYYGAASADPTADPNGNPPTAGDLYFNTTTNTLRTFNGTAWEDPGTVDLNAYLAKSGGDMTGVLGVTDGTAVSPGLVFALDQDTGFYRPAANAIGLATAGVVRVTVTGTSITLTPVVLAPDGTAAAPAFSFSGDTDTGVYHPTADTLGFTAGGALRLSVSTDAVTSTLPVSLPGDPTTGLQAAPKQYVDAQIATAVDNRVAVSGDTMTGDLVIAKTTPALILKATSSGSNRLLAGAAPSGAYRWSFDFGNGIAETGGNAGSGFSINRYSDTGVYLSSPIYIARDSGQTYFNDAAPVVPAPTWSSHATNKSYVDAQIATAVDDRVAVSGDTMTGNLTIAKAVSSPTLILKAESSGLNRLVAGAAPDGAYRWTLKLGGNAAETGGNAGSGFSIDRYSDTGSYLSSPIYIARDSGQVYFNDRAPVVPAPAWSSHAVNRSYVDVRIQRPITSYGPGAFTESLSVAELANDHYVSLFGATADGVFNLPDITTVPAGTRTTIANSSTSNRDVLVVAFEAQGINGWNSIILFPGDAVTLIASASRWITEGFNPTAWRRARSAAASGEAEIIFSIPQAPAQLFRIEISGFRNLTTDKFLAAQFSYDGGVTYDSGATDYTRGGMRATAGTVTESTVHEDSILVIPRQDTSSNSARNANATFEFFPGDSTLQATLIGSLFHVDTSGVPAIRTTFARRNAPGRVSHIRFSAEAGNMRGNFSISGRQL